MHLGLRCDSPRPLASACRLCTQLALFPVLPTVFALLAHRSCLFRTVLADIYMYVCVCVCLCVCLSVCSCVRLCCVCMRVYVCAYGIDVVSSLPSLQSFWESQVEVYLQRGLVELEDLQSVINLRSHFQQAVVSYIILQEIDYQAMVCQCSGARGVVLDGTKVAYKALNAHLHHCWRVPPSQERKPQTDPKKILFLAGVDKKLKTLLHRFSDIPSRFDVKKAKTINTKAGLSKEDYDLMMASVGSSQHTNVQHLKVLLESPRVIEGGNDSGLTYYPSDDVHDLLMALVSDYPCQAILPPFAIAPLDSFLKGDPLALQDLKATAPLVYNVLALQRTREANQALGGLLLLLCTISSSALPSQLLHATWCGRTVGVGVCVCGSAFAWACVSRRVCSSVRAWRRGQASHATPWHAHRMYGTCPPERSGSHLSSPAAVPRLTAVVVAVAPSQCRRLPSSTSATQQQQQQNTIHINIASNEQFFS